MTPVSRYVLPRLRSQACARGATGQPSRGSEQTHALVRPISRRQTNQSASVFASGGRASNGATEDTLSLNSWSPFTLFGGHRGETTASQEIDGSDRRHLIAPASARASRRGFQRAGRAVKADYLGKRGGCRNALFDLAAANLRLSGGIHLGQNTFVMRHEGDQR